MPPPPKSGSELSFRTRCQESAPPQCDDLYKIVINGQALITTEDHPFYNLTDHQWQRADKLSPGDHLLTPNDSIAIVSSVSAVPVGRDMAYNLTVDDIHTYHVLAGKMPILVHNTCAEIGLNSASEAYVKKNHMPGGRGVDDTKGLFNDDEDLYELADDANNFPGSLQGNGNCAHVCEADHVIGREAVSDGEAPTSPYTVIHDRWGEVVTMHPGVPR